MSGSSLWQEFKAFAMKGNMIDLAVAVVIGAAFGDIIKSLVGDVIMPLISYITPKMPYADWHLGKVMIGHFINNCVYFFIIAGAVFIVIVKLLGAVMKATAGTPKPSEPTTKECPFCLSVIPIKATRCAHCTSELSATSIA